MKFSRIRKLTGQVTQKNISLYSSSRRVLRSHLSRKIVDINRISQQKGNSFHSYHNATALFSLLRERYTLSKKIH